MRRLGVRVLMAAVGLATFVLYAGVASFFAWGLVGLWQARGDLLTLLVVSSVLTLAFSYASYRVGTSRLVSRLDARAVPRQSAPELHRRLDNLCTEMGVERPPLLVARMPVPNAMAVGGVGTGSILLDRRLFRLLGTDELETILAHELSHLESNDSLVQTLAYSLGQSLVWVVVVVTLPLVVVVVGATRTQAWLRGDSSAWTTTAFGEFRRRTSQVALAVLSLLTLLVLAHSRKREFAADDRAATVTRKPRALASALRKIERASEPRLGLLTPLYVRGDEDGWLTEILSTHPATDERVRRLVERAEANATTIEVR
ncbi:M48 family metallopeptidase [Halorussus halophilus]|uniref:M48 family metallopeptidase n=1 Tax=Halorussus halophilus TaxID=2650975 RepID=UPI001CE45A01|nr:M48 family metalloprotease [Halorussus halophilus]